MMYNFFGENLMNEIVDGLTKSFNEIGNELGNFPVHRASMKTDVKLSDEAMTIVIDLPGVAKEDIKAELKDGSLVVTAKREAVTEEADGDWVLKERFAGEVTRSYPVGDKVKKEDIKATFDNGVLTLIVPKEVEKPEEDNTIIIG